jgi:hypothetical protein
MPDQSIQVGRLSLKELGGGPMVVAVRQENLQKIINIQPLRNGLPIYVFRRQKP